MSASEEEGHVLPIPEHLEFDPSAFEEDLRRMRWIRDWQWSQQFAPPGPLIIVTGI